MLYREPNVYVELQSPQVTPIAPAPTSTAGFVGATQRGPTKPQVVTSLGEFFQIYGGPLDRADFTHNGRTHYHLPDAVAGFFRNEGRIAYVARVVPEAAARAEFTFSDQGPANGGASTRLLLGAPRGTGTAAQLPLAYVLDSGLANPDTIRIGTGSQAENHVVVAAQAVGAGTIGLAHAQLANAISASLAQGSVVDETTFAADTVKFFNGSNAVFDLAESAERGAREIVVSMAAANVDDGREIGSGAGDMLEIGTVGPGSQFVRAIGSEQIVGSAADFRVRLRDALVQDVEPGAGLVRAITSTAAGNPRTLLREAAAGTTILAVDEPGVNDALRTPGTEIEVRDALGALVAVARIASLGELPLDWPLAEAYPVGTAMRRVTSGPAGQVTSGGGGQVTFDLGATDGLFPGLPVLVRTGGLDEAVTVTAVDDVANEITVTPALATPIAAGFDVVADYQLTGPARQGDVLVALNSRLGLDPAGEARVLVEIGLPGQTVLLEVDEIPGPRLPAPDAGGVILAAPVPVDYPAGTPVRVMTPPQTDDTVARSRVVVPAAVGNDILAITGDATLAAGDLVSVNLASGGQRHHRLSAPFASVTPAQVELDRPMDRAQPGGAAVMEATPVLRVIARDQGGGGNQLHASFTREEQGLVAGTEVTAQPAADQIRVASLNGIHPGTVLELVDPVTGTQQGPAFWVEETDAASGNLVRLGAPLDAANLPAVGLNVRSVEYRLTIRDILPTRPGEPAPAQPVVATEVFDKLSLSSAHPRYALDIVGSSTGEIDPVLGLPRGQSNLVRLDDEAATPLAAFSLRNLALLTDTTPSGETVSARNQLLRGTDLVNLLTDLAYQGNVSNDPDDRTGIESLRNVPASIILAPGITTSAVQNRLIQQCETLGDRFALLDTPEDATTSVQATINHRKNYDSRCAAMFTPWLETVDPTGIEERRIVPPSGHMAGLYARTDLRRGVHKPPANENVLGISGINTIYTGTEHGILNAPDVQVNVIRRYEDRGTRLMGARTCSSDPAYAYVNVTRLVISITVALEAGLQSVIFEPNDRRLWRRVHRSISNYLQTLWRDGALFGATADAAFFVRVDETTMTEDDILQGRLIAIAGIAPVRAAEFIIIRLEQIQPT